MLCQVLQSILSKTAAITIRHALCVNVLDILTLSAKV